MADRQEYEIGSTESTSRRRPPLTARLVMGLVFVTLGALWTLDNLHVLDASSILRWWPVLLLIYGLARLTGLGARRTAGQYAERIVVKDGANVHERLDVVEAQDDYVEIRAEGRAHLKHQALAALAEALDPARFVRVHRSYLVNVERIARLELLAKDSRIAILHDGRQIPVSRSGHERLRELLA